MIRFQRRTRALRHKDFHLYLEQGKGELFEKDCTFKERRAGGKVAVRRKRTK